MRESLTEPTLSRADLVAQLVRLRDRIEAKYSSYPDPLQADSQISLLDPFDVLLRYAG